MGFDIYCVVICRASELLSCMPFFFFWISFVFFLFCFGIESDWEILRPAQHACERKSRMCGCVDVWMCGCVDVWMCGCVDVWMDGWMGGYRWEWRWISSEVEVEVAPWMVG
jgi:hypothetical protein